MRSYAYARLKAVDLANGGGKIDVTWDEVPGKDKKPWKGVPHYLENDVRAPPLLWEGQVVRRIEVALDGYASYGRLVSDPVYADPDFVDCPADQIETVLRELGKDVSDFELLGDVPTKYASQPVYVFTADAKKAEKVRSQ